MFTPSGKSLAPIAIAASVLVLIGVVLLAIRADSGPTASADPLLAFEKMRHLAGEDAVACGQVPRETDATAMVECIEASLRAKRAFWGARESYGIDSRLWLGYVRTRNGSQYVVLYDHDITGGRDERRKAYIHVESCPQFVTRHEGRLGPWCLINYEGHQIPYP